MQTCAAFLVTESAVKGEHLAFWLRCANIGETRDTVFVPARKTGTPTSNQREWAPTLGGKGRGRGQNLCS